MSIVDKMLGRNKEECNHKWKQLDGTISRAPESSNLNRNYHRVEPTVEVFYGTYVCEKCGKIKSYGRGVEN